MNRNKPLGIVSQLHLSILKTHVSLKESSVFLMLLK